MDGGTSQRALRHSSQSPISPSPPQGLLRPRYMTPNILDGYGAVAVFLLFFPGHVGTFDLFFLGDEFMKIMICMEFLRSLRKSDFIFYERQDVRKKSFAYLAAVIFISLIPYMLLFRSFLFFCQSPLGNYYGVERCSSIYQFVHMSECPSVIAKTTGERGSRLSALVFGLLD